jgi:hypothetical protein
MQPAACRGVREDLSFIDWRPALALLNNGNRIRFDFGLVRRLSDELAKLSVARPLIVTDRGVRATGLVDRVVESTVYDGTPGNDRCPLPL